MPSSITTHTESFSCPTIGFLGGRPVIVRSIETSSSNDVEQIAGHDVITASQYEATADIVYAGSLPNDVRTFYVEWPDKYIRLDNITLHWMEKTIDGQNTCSIEINALDMEIHE